MSVPIRTTAALTAALGLSLVALPSHAQNGPSREDVVDFFSSLRADLLTCGRGWHGSFDVDVDFAGDGSVTNVAAQSSDTPPDHVRACVVSVLHGGHIRAFTAPTAHVEHSLRL